MGILTEGQEELFDDGVNTRFDNGETLLHVACIAESTDCITYLSSIGSDQQALDSQGRTAIDVSLSPKVQRILQPAKPTQSFAKQVPTLYDKEIMFEMAAMSAQTDELLYKLQLFQFDVNGEDNEEGDYLMHIATKEGLSQLELLLSLVKQHKADINITNKEGMTPLMIAAELGDHVITDMMIVVLGANPNQSNPINGSTALHYCCAFNHLDTASVLLRRGADFNMEDQQGMRPDDVAVRCGYPESSSLIQSHRFQRCSQLNEQINCDTLSNSCTRQTDIITTDKNGFTLLMVAAQKNKARSLKFLLSKPDSPIDAQHEKTLMTALSYAAAEGSLESVTLLMKHRANPAIADMNRMLPLHHAVRSSHGDVVEELLKSNRTYTGLPTAFDLTSEDSKIRAIIVRAQEKRQKDIVKPALFECVVSGNAEKLFNLLEYGDDVNITSDFGQWPLRLAVENGHLEVMNILIDFGADLYKRCHPGGSTLLHLASSRGYPEIVLRLIQLYRKQENPGSPRSLPGPDSVINAVEDRGLSAVVLAAENGHVKTLSTLLNHGASSACPGLKGYLYRCKDYDGCQAIIELHRTRHLAKVMAALVKKGKQQMLEEVFVPKLDHHLRTSTGDTPLMVACYYNNVPAIHHLMESAYYCIEIPRLSSENSIARKSVSTASLSGHDSGTCLDHIMSGHSDDEDKRGITESQNGLEHEGIKKEDHEECRSFQTDDEPKFKPLVIVEGSVTKLGEHFQIGTSNPTATLRNMDFYMNQQTPEEEIANVWLEALDDLPPEDDYERTVINNVAKLFDSVISTEGRNSILLTDMLVSHLCAVNPQDGATCFHRLVQGGDYVNTLELLLQVETSGLNIQDKKGWSALHLAVYLKRRKIVERLLKEPFVDIEIRTLDGFLPEEMTSDKRIRHMFQQVHSLSSSREHSNPFSSFVSFLATTRSMSKITSDIDFDELNNRYDQIKRSQPRIPDVQDQSVAMYSWI